MKELMILYVANLILDYPLQGSFLAEYKAKNNYILFVHCAIWAFGLSVVLMPLGLLLITGSVEDFIRSGTLKIGLLYILTNHSMLFKYYYV